MISLGILKGPATFFHTDSFSEWNPALERFDPSFTGRLYPFDRFKTIYHRPTRRETLGVDDNVILPDSMVIRHDASGEVFIVGETLRFDSDGNYLYDRAYSLHRPSMFLDVIRPAIQGSGDDLGPLVSTSIGKLHLDTELRTAETERDAYEKFKGRFFITMPDSLKIQKGDFLVGDGKSFRVTIQYYDGGYQMARADEFTDEREVLTYKLPTGSGAAYDPATGTYTASATVDRQFSAIVSPVSDEEASDKTELQAHYIRLYIEFDHIGFSPAPENRVVRGVDNYLIKKVKSDPESKQWVVDCRMASNV